MIHFSKKILIAATLTDAESAVNLVKTCLENDLNIMEITFRTEITAEAIRKVTKEFPDFIIGAGTILTPEQISIAADKGAHFGLSPGFNKNVVKKARELGLPFIPGVATPSEIEQALEMDCRVLKFFPAESMGGVAALRALSGPYNHTGVKFIPMGGISEGNMKEYLQLETVVAVGGSWLAPREEILSGEFHKISEKIRDSVRQVQ